MRPSRPRALALTLFAAVPTAGLIPGCAGPETRHAADEADEGAAEQAADEGPLSPIAAELAAANSALDAIAAMPDSERTYENTVLAIDDTVADLFNAVRIEGFMAQVSTDADERARGRQAAADLSGWFNVLNRRADLDRACQVVADAGPELAPEHQRLLEVTLRDFRREGVGLPEAESTRLAEIDDELTELGIDFRQNIAEDDTTLPFTAEELAGVPGSYLDSLPQTGGLYLVRANGPAFGYIFGYAENETTRQKFAAAASLRAGGNVEVLEKILKLRAEKARLLGYAHTADYEIETKMAKDAATVWAFYEELKPKLRVKAEQDFAEYQAAKREHTGDPEAVLQAWDTSFYKNWLLRERYAVDSEEVREYFSVEQVTKGIFDVSQELFGLRFVEITADAEDQGYRLWHEDARLYEVWDDETDELLGRFYTDLHPRDNKYNHAAQFPLELRKRWPDGTLTKPLVALVCNFTKPTADRPALLSHSEVETFFHEFGHCLHSILTEAEIANFSGTNVARDFVEAPSQMLENWMWNADVLARFAKHYETGEPLPKDTLDRMILAQNLGSGLAAEGQLFLGVLDMTYHTDPDGELDTTAVRREVYADTRMFEPLPNLHGQASFGHLVGYQAGYYGYLWSLVYAQDMFSRFDREGILNKATAREYRERVLSRGGTMDELDIIRDFLGREPNSDAFLEHLGLE